MRRLLLDLPRTRYTAADAPASLPPVAGVLLLLALFAFWVMGHGAPAYEAQFDNAVEPRKQLVPLEDAPMKPLGGGMIARANASSPTNATANRTESKKR